MATRTFGWIQNPSSTDTLKDILGLFCPRLEIPYLYDRKKIASVG